MSGVDKIAEESWARMIKQGTLACKE
jgi:hypothetical protein